jgi:hypothetical protein
VTEPNWSRLRSVAEEADRLHETGRLDLTAFERLRRKAAAAAPGNSELTEFMALFTPIGFVSDIDQEQGSRLFPLRVLAGRANPRRRGRPIRFLPAE